eukprot:GABV01000214.1.p1 GENE.GABV01000214.1~~GABV01000214.1.p1  ORF type:complete len:235 (-),score=98.98 GABV01000214.1:355-1059(-)
MLTRETSYFNTLFRALQFDDKDVNQQVWALLMHLPTNPAMKAALLKLDDIVTLEDWNKVIDPTNVYKLMYALQVVEVLAQSEAPEHTGDAARDAAAEVEHAPEALDARANWRKHFLHSQGFDHLYSILMHAELFNPETLENSEIHKGCLAKLLKLVHTFILSAISSTKPLLAEIVSRVRSESMAAATTPRPNGGDDEPLPPPPGPPPAHARTSSTGSMVELTELSDGGVCCARL